MNPTGRSGGFRSTRFSVTLSPAQCDPESLKLNKKRQLKKPEETIAAPGINSTEQKKVFAELPAPARQPAKGNKPEMVKAILRNLYAEAISQEGPAVLETRLQKPFMPHSDRIAMMHCFIHPVMPYPTAGPGWFVTLSRFPSYKDQENQSIE